ncbi:MAG TPA: hypothetical protein DIC65_06335 [Actinobacteria bacterium]|nr:hypothetical protein [Actinomycetota bacterium]
MATVKPRVSIGMPVFGGETHLRASIQSVINQNFRDWELILLDDCSPDRSLDVIDTFQDERILLLRNASNQGLVAARNRIMDESTGEFLAWLDQDDLAFPDRIATQVQFLERHPHVSVCGSFTETLMEQRGLPSRVRLEVFPKSHHAIRASMAFLNPMACNTVTMRLKDFRERGLTFRPEFGNSLDYDMWSQASDRLLFENIPRPLGAYRVHPQQTSQGAALEVMNQQAIRVQVELIERSLQIPISTDQRSLHASATIAPLDIHDAEHLQEIASWLASLRQANLRHRAFDVEAFDQMLVRQWTTCLLAVRPTMDRAAFARSAALGTRRIHPKVRSAMVCLVSGVRRRRIQRTRPAVPRTDF